LGVFWGVEELGSWERGRGKRERVRKRKEEKKISKKKKERKLFPYCEGALPVGSQYSAYCGSEEKKRKVE